MILLLGSPDDLCARETGALLRERGHEILSVAEAELRRSLQIAWELPAAGNRDRLALGDVTVPLDRLSGVLVRMGTSFRGELAESDDENYRRAEWGALLYGFLNGLPCPVINRPRPGIDYRTPAARAIAQAVKASGFTLPQTLVTASAEAALAFFENHGRRVYDGGPSNAPGVFLEGPAGRETLAAGRGRSFHLQAVPAGAWRRMVVVGREAFAVLPDEPTSAGPAGGPWRSGIAPEPLSERCVQLAAGLNLPFMEVLAIGGDDGRDVLFTVCDSPSIDRCGETVRRCIAEALAGLLQPSGGGRAGA